MAFMGRLGFLPLSPRFRQRQLRKLGRREPRIIGSNLALIFAILRMSQEGILLDFNSI